MKNILIALLFSVGLSAQTFDFSCTLLIDELQGLYFTEELHETTHSAGAYFSDNNSNDVSWLRHAPSTGRDAWPSRGCFYTFTRRVGTSIISSTNTFIRYEYPSYYSGGISSGIGYSEYRKISENTLMFVRGGEANGGWRIEHILTLDENIDLDCDSNDPITIDCDNLAGTYYVLMQDSYGDGWQDSRIKITIDRNDPIYIAMPCPYTDCNESNALLVDYKGNDSSGESSFIVPDGTINLKIEFERGTYPAETTYSIMKEYLMVDIITNQDAGEVLSISCN